MLKFWIFLAKLSGFSIFQTIYFWMRDCPVNILINSTFLASVLAVATVIFSWKVWSPIEIHWKPRFKIRLV